MLKATIPRPRLGSLLVPLVWVLFFAWALLRFDNQWQSNAATYFVGLVSLTFILFTAATILVRQSGNPATWSWFISFFAAGFFLLANTNYPSWENYNHLISLAITFPRYFTGDVALVAIVALGAWFYRSLWPKANLAWLDFVGVILIIIAGIDLRLSQIMGVRLGWDVLSFGDSPKMMFRMSKPYLPGALAGLAVVLMLYGAALRAFRIWNSRRLLSANSSVQSNGLCAATSFGSGPCYLAIVFLLLGVLGLATADSDKAAGQPMARMVQTSPLWRRVTTKTFGRDEFLKTAESLGLGDLSQAHSLASIQPQRDLNVLLVFMESSYNKHLSLFGSSEETQPLLSNYKERMELFPNFFSAFAGSIHARFATFTSLYPVSDFHAFTQERVPVKSLFEVLHDHGYSCSMFYSSYFDYTGFRDFLKDRGLDEMYDADTMPAQHKSEHVEWGLTEEETLGAIRAQLQKYAQSHRRFCLTYVPAAPHNPFDKVPKRFQKYKAIEVGDLAPAYLNELLYMDWVLASILDQLKESGLLDNTLVVITNDHGEMLGGKDGHIGHGWRITPELANTPLIVMDPQRPGFQINKTIGTQVDLLPTLLDRLKIPAPADQLYEGVSLDSQDPRNERFGYLNSYKQFAIITGNQILTGDREVAATSSAPGSGRAYSIANEGTKTIFTEGPPPANIQDRQTKMARFDAFQQNLLRNYSAYCSSIRAVGQTQAKRSEK